MGKMMASSILITTTPMERIAFLSYKRGTELLRSQLTYQGSHSPSEGEAELSPSCLLLTTVLPLRPKETSPRPCVPPPGQEHYVLCPSGLQRPCLAHLAQDRPCADGQPWCVLAAQLASSPVSSAGPLFQKLPGLLSKSSTDTEECDVFRPTSHSSLRLIRLFCSGVFVGWHPSTSHQQRLLMHSRLSREVCATPVPLVTPPFCRESIEPWPKCLPLDGWSKPTPRPRVSHLVFSALLPTSSVVVDPSTPCASSTSPD